ncbi:toll/interleukin-1 receptor domain-containing protein [Dyella solisilvae]|uniref:Toll/interleukin-1 receptor domain-containing protein n=1 Tax=Dyella solisilvae TaxID=1920168 RepID=A0A370K4K3_9GAMM|nr:toll/interleukin-1 receptor domain-containing protein [Dyella solisilvae]RDI97581.1 toll/interleukin-1 receptor domain-containing protein [Dyella solisilvae]
MAQGPVLPEFRYRAFISYSHQDKTWADWLHKALETYRVPRRLVGQATDVGPVPRRLAPVFRDREELASATDLGRKVNEALLVSANLIVICSPRSAASRWVNEEVLAFKRLGRGERIFCLIVDGEPNASTLAGREAEECFAPALRFELDADGALGTVPTEPIAADARPGKDGKANAKLKLIAGLLDLGYDSLKRRELQRRMRRLTAVAMLSLIVMAATSILAIAAVVARNAAVVATKTAERRQKQAENLINFMLGDLNDKLQEVSRLDIMESVDDQAMRYFRSLPVDDVNDEALAQRAKALERIGAVRLDQGHLPAALDAFQAASVIDAKLTARNPGNTAWQLAYARLLAYIGMTHWRQGDLDAAKTSFESARLVLTDAGQHAANDHTLQFELAMVDNNIGHVLEAQGHLDLAEDPYRNVLKLCEALVKVDPNHSEWGVQLGGAHNNLGKLALMRGDLATAITEYAADNAIETRLSEQNPRDNSQKENVVTSRAILGRTLALTGDVETGSRQLQEAIDLAVQLMKIDSQGADARADFALYSSQLARLRRLAGDSERATRLLDQSLEMFTALTRQDPDNSGWRREFAEAQTERAEQSRGKGQADLAQRQVREAEAMLAALLAQQPHDRATLLAEANAKRVLASVTEDRQDAQRIAEEALQRIQSVTSGREDPRLLALEVQALLALDRTDEAKPIIRKLWNTGYRDLALVEVLRHAHIDYPVNAAFTQELATRMN